MKLTHPDIGICLNFEDNLNYQLIIENTNEFLKLTTEFYNQTNGKDGNFVLSENLKEIDLAKKSILLYDFLNFSLNTKKILSEINSEFSDAIKNNDFLNELSQINFLLNNLNQKILDIVQLPVFYNEELSPENFVKISNYELDDNIPFIQKISTLVDIYSKIKNLKLVAFINIFDYITINDINTLIKDINYRDVNILFINRKKIVNVVNTKTITIDNDLCVF